MNRFSKVKQAVIGSCITLLLVGLSMDATVARTTNLSVSSTSKPFYGSILVTQIKDAAESIVVDIFPNPPSKEIHVKLGQTESGFRLRMLDMENGKEMMNESVENLRKKTIDVSSYEIGTYHLHLLDASSRSLKVYEIKFKK